MNNENSFLNRKSNAIHIRAQLTDFLFDILGAGFIPAMSEISEDAFRQKRKRMNDDEKNIQQKMNSDFYKDYRNQNEIYEDIDRLNNNINELHRSIHDIADKLVLLRGPHYTPNPQQQQFCYAVFADVFRGEKPNEHKDEDPHIFYSETYWNAYELITDLLRSIEATAWKFEIGLFDENEAFSFYIKESLKEMGKYPQKPLNLDIKEYFTAFQDVLANWETNESFFKYPFNAFRDYLKENHGYKLEDFYELWNPKKDTMESTKKDLCRSNINIKRRNWSTVYPMLYDPDYLLNQTQREKKILKQFGFDIKVKFVVPWELEYRLVDEPEATEKNFALKQQYRLFQARLFMAYLLNNIYTAMQEKKISTKEIEEIFKGNPNVFNFHITDNCNYNCNHCFVNKEGNELSTENAFKIIDNIERYFLKKNISNGRINLAGGEPLLHKEIQKVIDYISAKKIEVSLITNGSLLTEKFIQDNIGKLSMIGLSVDSLDNATNEMLERCDNSDNSLSSSRILDLSQWIKKANIKLKINICVSKNNVYENFVDFLNEISPDRLKLLQMTIEKGVNDNSIDDTISEQDFNNFCEKYSQFDPIIEPSEKMQNSYFIIDSKGILGIDNAHNKSQSNLLNRELSDVIDNLPINKKYFRDRY
jgi:radical S-adenosyl methionine domain-containing protein 2